MRIISNKTYYWHPYNSPYHYPLDENAPIKASAKKFLHGNDTIYLPSRYPALVLKWSFFLTAKVVSSCKPQQCDWKRFLNMITIHSSLSKINEASTTQLGKAHRFSNGKRILIHFWNLNDFFQTYYQSCLLSCCGNINRICNLPSRSTVFMPTRGKIAQEKSVLVESLNKK